MKEFDGRTESNLETMLPQAQELFRRFLRKTETLLPADIDIRVIDGSRTYAEQQAIYNKGRTTPGPRVTNAKPGSSWHNFGIAGDIGVFQNGKYLPESSYYEKVGPIGESVGLEWGGRWKTIHDAPHFQFPLGITLAEARQRVSNNTPLIHTQKVPEDKPLVWTVIYDGKQIIENCKDTPSIRALAEALGKTLVVDSKNKIITVK